MTKTEIHGLARTVRKDVSEALMWFDAGDYQKAYAAAERSQHGAFDLKSAINEYDIRGVQRLLTAIKASE